MNQSEADHLLATVESALVQRLEDQCIKDGAEQQAANSCVRSILRFAIKCAVQEAPEPLRSADVIALKKLANRLSKSAESLDGLDIRSQELLDFINPTLRLFTQDLPKISKKQLSLYLRQYAEAIRNEIEQIKLKPGRQVASQLTPLVEFTTTKWKEATGHWPPLTKSVEDGEPTHELFVCIPIILAQLPEPYSDLATKISERSLCEAAGKFIASRK